MAYIKKFEIVLLLSLRRCGRSCPPRLLLVTAICVLSHRVCGLFVTFFMLWIARGLLSSFSCFVLFHILGLLRFRLVPARLYLECEHFSLRPSGGLQKSSSGLDFVTCLTSLSLFACVVFLLSLRFLSSSIVIVTCCPCYAGIVSAFHLYQLIVSLCVKGPFCFRFRSIDFFRDVIVARIFRSPSFFRLVICSLRLDFSVSPLLYYA